MPQYVDDPVLVDPAPVLTFWATVVAERLGYPSCTALTLGRALIGLLAPVKAQSTGQLLLLGQIVPMLFNEDGELCAANGDQPVNPSAVSRYLTRAFGKRLAEVGAAMEVLAARYTPAGLNRIGCVLYERFKPRIPRGGTRWSMALDVRKILAAGTGQPCQCQAAVYDRPDDRRVICLVCSGTVPT